MTDYTITIDETEYTVTISSAALSAFGLGDLSDVDNTDIGDGKFLQYESASGKHIYVASSSTVNDINDIGNVTITSPTDNQVLAYDTATTEWINQTVAAGITSHTDLTELDVDDHTQYALLDGTRDFTNTLGISQSNGEIGLAITHSGSTGRSIDVVHSSPSHAAHIHSTSAVPSSSLAKFTATDSSFDADIIEVVNEGTGNGITIDQNGNGVGLYLDSEATDKRVIDIDKLSTNSAAGIGIGVDDGAEWVGLLQGRTAAGGTNHFQRNLPSTSTAGAVVFVEQDHATDDQDALKIQQDGTGYAINVTAGEINIPTGELYKINGSQHTHTATNVTDFDTEVSNNSSVSSNTSHRGLTNNPHSVDASDVEATDKNFVTDAQLVVVGNTSGTNTGDNATNTQYSSLVSNATHTGEVTGSTALTIANNIVDEANMKISNSPTNDYVLTADSGATGGWKWAASSSGFSDPMTTRGDIIYKDSSNNTTRLAIGSNGQALMSDGTDVAWATPSGSGNVSTSGTPVDNDFAKFVNSTDIEGRTYAEVRTDLNVADGATANSADATLLARANHTGTQTASTISDFDTEVSNNSSVTANSAKVTYNSTDSTKVGFISVTQAVNLDTMESNISTNNSKITYPSADSTKVGHISVTQAVNLDTMESNIATNNSKVTYPGSADATELNILDGATLTTTELNYVDGVTSSIQSQLNAKGTGDLDNVVEDTTPQLGGLLDLNSKGIKITGQTVAGSAGQTVYLSSANTWSLIDASAEATCSGMVASVLSSTEVMLKGVITTTGLTAAATYYASTTAGYFTTTAPSATGDIVRIIGYALSTTEFFFDPDKTYIEVA